MNASAIEQMGSRGDLGVDGPEARKDGGGDVSMLSEGGDGESEAFDAHEFGDDEGTMM